MSSPFCLEGRAPLGLRWAASSSSRRPFTKSPPCEYWGTSVTALMGRAGWKCLLRADCKTASCSPGTRTLCCEEAHTTLCGQTTPRGCPEVFWLTTNFNHKTSAEKSPDDSSPHQGISNFKSSQLRPKHRAAETAIPTASSLTHRICKQSKLVFHVPECGEVFNAPVVTGVPRSPTLLPRPSLPIT